MPLINKIALSELDTLYIWELTEDYMFFQDRINLSSLMEHRYNDITSKRRKAEWLVSKYIIRSVFPNCVLMYERQKLIILYGKIEVSVSHNKNYCCVLISNNCCGVDIESLDRNYDNILNKYLNDSDLKIISTKLQKAIAWSAKEALYKMIHVDNLSFKDELIITAISDSDIFINYREMSFKLRHFIFDNCVICYSFEMDSELLNKTQLDKT